jgi:hypothetical protein
VAKWVAVIGGGPAGLAAAEVLAAAGLSVSLHDRMPSLARKFLMAGRGGLNLTHSEPFDAFARRYGRAAEAIRPSLDAFPPAALTAWAEALGEPTFVGSSGRVFPRSFKASPLLRAWLGRLAAAGVVFETGARWVGFEDGAVAFETRSGRRTLRPDAVVLALGGASWPRLGSDGAWVPLLEREGVPVEPLSPTNCGFAVEWSDLFRDRFQGEPLKRIGLSLGGQAVKGEAVVTAEGLEGGAVYALSGPIRRALARGPVTVLVDLKPGMTDAEIALGLERVRAGDSLTNRLRKGAGLPPVAVGLMREAHGKDLAQDPKALAGLVKAVPVRIVAARPIDRAISTAGGVVFEALDERLMLRALPGVFVAGEMLDWEAPTGGYLLQGAIATGRRAGQGAVAWLADQLEA